MVLVDNAAYSYAFQPENGIPILPYYQGDKDF
jgi:TFIIF-interacting CTD phosphatase-like protein